MIPALQWPQPTITRRLFMTLAIAIAGLPAVWVYDQSIAGENGASETATMSLGPPTPPLMTVRPLAPAAAIQVNRAIPFADIPNPPAKPFVFRGSAQTHHRALTCLTAAIYYEAGSEPVEGQRAVAQVILNRVRHPAYPASICAVVYQGSTLPTGCQFTFTCDGSLNRPRSASIWARAEAVAAAALAGNVFEPVGHALNYHANFVVPYWASSLAKKAIVGTHIFYRLPGYWGEQPAFRRAYAALEADPVTLRATALAARERRGPSTPQIAKPQVTVNADPRVELLGVVEMLASRRSDGDTPIAKAARADFGRFSNHLAVEIYRQLAAKNERLSSHLLAQVVAFPEIAGDAPLTFPALNIPGLPNAAGAGLAEALGAFAKDSSFAEFFAKHQSHYRPLKDASLASTVPIVAAFQNYTGSGAGPIKLFLAPLAQRSFVANCEEAGNGTLVLFVGEDGLGAARMLASALAHRALGANGCGPAVRRDCRTKTNRLAIVQDQIARQLAVRALQADADPGKRTVKGPALAVPIGEGLKTYELNRRYFPTFRDFQPILLQSIASSDRPGAAPRTAAAKLKLPVSLRSSGKPADPVCDALRRSSQA
jgi:spore germination cell wall hydrolase CwlJ-like protein